MNNKLTITLKKGTIKEYQKKMIAELSPTIFLPMSFVIDGDIERVTYDCDNFIPLSLFSEILTSGKAFLYLEHLMEILALTGEYLLMPENIAINKSTVYVGSSGTNMKLLYLPTESASRNLNQTLYGFVEELEGGYITQNLKGYLEHLKSLLNQGIGQLELMNFISKIKREIYLSGIN